MSQERPEEREARELRQRAKRAGFDAVYGKKTIEEVNHETKVILDCQDASDAVKNHPPGCRCSDCFVAAYARSIEKELSR